MCFSVYLEYMPIYTKSDKEALYRLLKDLNGLAQFDLSVADECAGASH